MVHPPPQVHNTKGGMKHANDFVTIKERICL